MNSHKTVLLSIMAALGLYDDGKPVLASNKDQMAERNFQTSRITPFSSNIGFVLYSCQPNQGTRTFRIEVMVNEQPVKLPACDSFLCPYEQVRNAYAGLIDICKFQQTCEKPLPKLDTFSITTTYDWANKVEEPVENEEYEISSDGEVCKAVHVSMLVRHGARYPYSDELDVLDGLLKKLLVVPKYKNILDWASRYTRDQAEKLVPTGAEEQFNIGRRTGLRFYSLLKNKGNLVKYVSSNEERNIKSSENFYKGLSDVVDGLGSFNNVVNASLLRYYYNCDAFKANIDREECRNYKHTPGFVQVINKLKASLGTETISIGMFQSNLENNMFL